MLVAFFLLNIFGSLFFGLKLRSLWRTGFFKHLIFLCVRLMGYPYTPREVKDTAVHFEVMNLEL